MGGASVDWILVTVVVSETGIDRWAIVARTIFVVVFESHPPLEMLLLKPKRLGKFFVREDRFFFFLN
jgi:hypothetical protein